MSDESYSLSRDYAERVGRWSRRPEWEVELSALLEWAGPLGGTVLDVGCGAGRAWGPLCEAGYGRYRGVDTNPNYFGPGDAPQYQVYDGRRLPYPDGSVDGVLINHVLGHVELPERTVWEAFRVVRRGGRVIVATPNRSYVRWGRLLWRERDDPTLRHHFTADGLARLMRPFASHVRSRTWGPRAARIGPRLRAHVVAVC